MVSIDYLESERKKLWERLLELQDSVKKKTSDYEKDARQHSKKCSEFRNKCESAKKEAESLLNTFNDISDKFSKSGVIENAEVINSFANEVKNKKNNLEANIQALDSLFESFPVYSEKINQLESLSTSADDSYSKIEATLNQLTTRKQEVDKVYYEIYGFSKTDPTTNVVTKVPGKKEELDKGFLELKQGFEKYSKEKKAEFDSTLNEWKKSFQAAEGEVRSLLPNALTRGLSYAYSEKKDKEVTEIELLKKSFRNWIFVLMAVSLIPFLVSAYMLIHDHIPVLQVIRQLTSLVSPLLMLYVPPLWIAISTNKKINLSKRLIEEYTHKEVVSKTFEGLSKQIEDIKDKTVSSELKTKLLRNILDVSTDNPGKLLSDYNKSDHPFLERVSGLLTGKSEKSVVPDETAKIQ